MITVHHLEHSRSQRVLWLLEELGLPYDVERYARDKKTSLAPAELAAIHPLGKSPVITDGKTVVAETGAIVEYLLDAAGDSALRPARGSADGLRFSYRLGDFIERVHARPAYQRALERGGPFSLRMS